MFAKPVKKTTASVAKQKAPVKAKAVSVKTGIRAPVAKKARPDSKGAKLKPLLRQDACYSLYSTDSEDQVGTAFTEMEACEKILTQLKSKQKDKTKVKKKKVTSPKPKALNDGPALSQVPTSLDYRLPYSTALYLRHLQSQDAANNPVYNSRLVSSTPDPDKLLADLSSSKLPANLKQMSHDQSEMAAMLKTGTALNNSGSQHDLPVRDVSGTSSVPPSYNHLRNMAEMVDLYKNIEIRKYQQLHEAALMAELQKLQSKKASNPQTVESGMSNPLQGQSATGQTFNVSDPGQGHVLQPGQSDGEDKRQSEGFIGSGSLGFSTGQGGSTAFKPIPFDASQLSAINGGLQGSLDLGTDSVNAGLVGRGSSGIGFQPFIESTGQVLPPSSWITGNQKQLQQHQALQAIKDLNSGSHGNIGDLGDSNTDKGQARVEPLKLLSDIVDRDKDAQDTGRTESTVVSQDTDYANLPRPASDGQGVLTGPVIDDRNIEFSKQNGLFQIRRVSDQQENSASDKSSSDSKGNGSVQVIPEKDVPAMHATNTQGTKRGSVSENVNKAGSQDLSDVTTPRNSSGTGSGISHSGRVVFIPSDNSATQNVIGYIPGMPMVTGLNQPMSWPVTYEVAPDGSVLSSVTGPNQGQATLQTTSQVTPQNVSGSGYPSSTQANNIAAGDIGVRKLRYLIKEMKECNKVTKDVEINRLVTDIDSTVNAIPQLALTFNIQTEIELAIQPLRSENSQLRRKLRLINQQLKEREDGKDINFEKLHLQTSNDTLQKVLKEEKEIKTRLAAEVQHVHGELHKMRVERSKMIAEVSEKETLNLKFRQETLLETQKMGHDVQIMKKEQEATTNKLEALEKENHILHITLQQRDAEIERQHDLVETMKESISDLLNELERSRTGEHGWDHNTSYGLNKLMQIMEEEGTGYSQKKSAQPRKQKVRRRTPERRQYDYHCTTPERRQFDFNSTTDSSSSAARLTREALAHHNRKHTPNGTRMGPDGRQGPASESELDTLVELNRKARDLSPKRGDGGVISRPVRRRTSSSSPVRLRKSPQGGGVLERDVNFHTKLRERMDNSRNRPGFEMYDKSQDRTGRNDRVAGSRYKRGFSKSCESSPAGKGGMPVFRDISPDFNKRISGSCNERVQPSNRTDVSDEQSRYSVTDYFRKYHKSSCEGQSSSLDDPRSHVPQGQRSVYPDRGQSSSLDDPRSLVPQGQRSLYPDRGQPVRNFQRAKHLRPDSRFQTSSEIDDQTVKSSNMAGNTNVKQRTLFKGMNYDDTISAIPDDDQLSSVSMSSVTTANTVDDKRFRSGIATLDANIAKLQMALQKTKSMLT